MVFRYFYKNKDVTTDQFLAGKILWLRTRNIFTIRSNETLRLHRKSINFAREIATEYFGENLNCLITARSAGGEGGGGGGGHYRGNALARFQVRYCQ